jgi:hypothetical protein
MTKKEKIIASIIQDTNLHKAKKQKEILKFIYTINKDFDNMSPFAWEEHHGGKKFKIKVKKLYNK